MKYTSTDIFAAIEKVIQKHRAYGARKDERDAAGEEYSAMVCYAVGDLQDVVNVVYNQENFNPELQDAYDIANFVLEWMEEKYDFGVWEVHIGGPSLKYTSAYTADAIRTFQEEGKKETEIALQRVLVLANMLGKLSWHEQHYPDEYKPAIENVNLTSVARFVSSLIAERMEGGSERKVA